MQLELGLLNVVKNPQWNVVIYCRRFMNTVHYRNYFGVCHYHVQVPLQQYTYSVSFTSFHCRSSDIRHNWKVWTGLVWLDPFRSGIYHY